MRDRKKVADLENENITVSEIMTLIASGAES